MLQVKYRMSLWLLLFSALAFPLQAANKFALVVGVSKYPNLPENMHLVGPRHDAEMIEKFLKQSAIYSFPSSNITVLGDGVEHAAVPTRKAILDAMDGLASKVDRDDFVYLHFSGHGSRQPAAINDNSETDGLDELFLPADIGQWNDAIGSVENALIDDEIGARIDAIRDQGAFVWAVFDSCHSGTVTRGAPVGDDVRMRKVKPSALGIPDELINRPSVDLPRTRGQQSPQAALETAVSKQGMGGMVAFYAAQSTEQTPEMRLPAGAPGRVPHGLFSFTLFQIIAEHPGITYRRAAQEVLQRYAASYMDRPTPLFEGDLDARVFATDAQSEKPQWPLEIIDESLQIPAGTISRLNKGSILAILQSPAADDDQALGYLTIEHAEPMQSTLVAIDYRDKKAVNNDALPEHAYARLVERKLDFSVRISRPDNSSPQVSAALDNLQAEDNSGLRILWVDAGMPADIRLAEKQNQLWLLPPTGELIPSGDNKTPSIKLEGKDAHALNMALLDNLTRVARVLNLLRVSEGIGAGSTSLDAFISVKRKNNGKTETIPVQNVPQLYPGDVVYLSAKNTGDNPVDLNILFVGSDYSISHWYKGRIHPNGALNKKGLFRVSDSSFGTERLLVIASKAKPQTAVQDFSFLTQRALPRTRGNSQEAGLSSLLKTAGFGQVTTRGVEPLSEESDSASIIQFTIHTREQSK